MDQSVDYKGKQLQQRRVSNSLGILGSVVVAQGAWGIAKSLMAAVDFLPGIFRQIEETTQENLMIVRVIVYFVVFLVILAVFSIRFYIGFSARAESMGAKRLPVYLAVSGILVGFYALSLVMSVLNFRSRMSNPADYFVSLLLDFTSLVLFADLIRSSAACRRLKKELQQYEAQILPLKDAGDGKGPVNAA